MSFTSSGSRYGGFGSDTLDYGGSSTYSGNNGECTTMVFPKGVSDIVATGGFSSGFRDSSRKQDFEEYDAGEWEDSPRRSAATSQTAGASGSSHTTNAATKPAAKREPKAAEPPKVQNLLDFDDDSWGTPTSAPAPVPAVASPTAAAPKPAISNDCESCIELSNLFHD